MIIDDCRHKTNKLLIILQ